MSEDILLTAAIAFFFGVLVGASYVSTQIPRGEVPRTCPSCDADLMVILRPFEKFPAMLCSKEKFYAGEYPEWWDETWWQNQQRMNWARYQAHASSGKRGPL